MKPIVLLDMDGVINAWGGSPRGAEKPQIMRWQGMQVSVYPETVRALRDVFGGAEEVIWCTAWRGEANQDPLRQLWAWGVAPEGRRLGVVTDGRTLWTGGFTTAWKLECAVRNPVVRRAMDEGREVVWIEDFDWHTTNPHIPEAEVYDAGFTPIDTGLTGHLTRRHLVGTQLEVVTQ